MSLSGSIPSSICKGGINSMLPFDPSWQYAGHSERVVEAELEQIDI